MRGPMVVGARTVTFPPGQTAGALSSLLPNDVQFLNAGGSSTLIGVKPPPGAVLGFMSGSDGATADLVIRGPDGSTLATVPGAITLPANSWTETTPDVLFAGVTLPDEGTVDVQPFA